MIESHRVLATDCAATFETAEDSLPGALEDESLPVWPSAAGQAPEGLSESHLATGVENCFFDKARANLPDKSGGVPALLAAVRRAHRWLWRVAVRAKLGQTPAGGDRSVRLSFEDQPKDRSRLIVEVLPDFRWRQRFE